MKDAIVAAFNREPPFKVSQRFAALCRDAATMRRTDRRRSRGCRTGCPYLLEKFSVRRLSCVDCISFPEEREWSIAHGRVYELVVCPRCYEPSPLLSSSVPDSPRGL